MTCAADAFYKTVFDTPGGPESLAPRLGMNAQILRNKANPNITTNHPNLNDIESVMTFTGNVSVLHAMAMRQNHICIPVDVSTSSSDMAVLELIAKVWSTNGNVGATVNATLEDGRVEMHEVAQVEQAVHRTVTALHEMLARLKGMAQ